MVFPSGVHQYNANGATLLQAWFSLCNVSATLAVPTLTPATAASGLNFNLNPKTTASTGAGAFGGGFNFGIPAKTATAGATGGFGLGLGAGVYCCFHFWLTKNKNNHIVLSCLD